MKYKTLIKKLNLKNEDFETIKKSVEEAEKKTTGEIALALAPESAHYSFWELLFANIVTSVILMVLVPFSGKISEIYNLIYWQNPPSWIVPLFFVVTAFASIVAIFYISNIPAIDRIIIPKTVKKYCVTSRAFRYFTESGVYATAEHSGILIYVSYMEKQVRIIADEGINAKISQDMWNLLADEMAENIKKGDVVTAFTTIVEKCGQLLAENFPNHEENPNELSDGLVILGDGEWF